MYPSCTPLLLIPSGGRGSDRPVIGARRKKWSDDRKPQALAVGAQGASEAKLTVKHDIKDQEELKQFKKHVSKMEEKGKRKEMGAQNMPF